MAVLYYYASYSSVCSLTVGLREFHFATYNVSYLHLLISVPILISLFHTLFSVKNEL